MHFAFTDDQLALRDAVRDLLAKECPAEVVRAAWPDGTDAHGARKGEGARADAERVDRVWAALADMGVLGVAVPEASGGLGMGPVDWVLVAEETGHAAVPHPFVETALVVAPLLAEVGDPEGVLGELLVGDRQAGVLPLGATTVAWGDRITHLTSIEWTAPVSSAGAAGASGASGATAAGAGTDPAADAADPASAAAVADPSGSTSPAGATSGPDGTWRARRIDAGVTIGPDGRRDLADALDPGRHLVQLGAWRSVATVGEGDVVEAAFDRGALGTAAQLVGLSRRMLDLTVAYVGERRQFGVPIGSFQAVKHHLADAALRLELTAPAVYGAAWSLATGQDTAGRDVSTAKALASDTARLVGRKALQCHGAIGYTTEYDLHLYLKRAEALARAWGDAAWHRRRVASALGI